VLVLKSEEFMEDWTEQNQHLTWYWHSAKS